MTKSKKESSKNETTSKTTKNLIPDSIKSNNNYDDHTSKDMIWVDPMYIRFQHSKIRPVFSSCGRTLIETLNSIRNNEIAPTDLPPIQVLIGPETSDGLHRWYFSLNNRRLWVLKRCREEGLLRNNNQIRVRVREAKSQKEIERYTMQNCVVEAMVIREKEKKNRSIKNLQGQASGAIVLNDDLGITTVTNRQDSDVDSTNQEVDDDSTGSTDSNVKSNNDISNRFSVLF